MVGGKMFGFHSMQSLWVLLQSIVADNPFHQDPKTLDCPDQRDFFYHHGLEWEQVIGAFQRP